MRCDLGTDCSDCGPYEALEPARKLPGTQGPISRLTGRNITVLTRLTNTRPGFMMPYTDPKQVALLACMSALEYDGDKLFLASAQLLPSGPVMVLQLKSLRCAEYLCAAMWRWGCPRSATA